MSALTRDALERVARLARLHLSEAEAARLAPALEGISRDFASLEAYAAELPAADAGPAGAPRADEVAPAPPDVVAAILRASTRVDPKSRSYQVPRERR